MSTDIPFQEASIDIWDKKYRLKTKAGEVIDETMDSTWQRIARALADVEQSDIKREEWYQKFLWALRHGAIPAGRITSNAGALSYKPATSTINCTVSGTIDDSMDGILQKVHEAGLTLKAGCGIGYEFSTLRPKGAFVAGAGAYTSGPLSFMDIYDKMCFTVSSAGGRRGAQMATFDVGHPDVFDYIRAKREDGRLRQFNLSLLITSDFMEAVKNDRDWPLAFPISAKERAIDKIDISDPAQVVWRGWPNPTPYITNEAGKVACRIYKTVKAKRLWDMIMSSTYDYAEPGFILIDEYNTMNNNWFCENIRATNPCVTAETWVQTDAGPRQVSDLIGQPFNAVVDGKLYASSVEGFFYTATKAIVELQCVEGYRLQLTADHRVRRITLQNRWRQQSEWCAVSDLKPDDQVLLHNHQSYSHWDGAYSRGEGYLVGLLIGDGTVKADGEAVLSVWQNHSGAVVNGVSTDSGTASVMAYALHTANALSHRSDFLGWRQVSGRDEWRLSTAAISHLVAKLGIKAGHKTVTPQMERGCSDFYIGLLQGLFDADGSVQGSQQKEGSVRLSQSDLAMLQAVQRMLLRLGVASRIYKRRPAAMARLPDGKGGQREYATQAQHELVISGSNLTQFSQQIGFIDSVKQSRLQQLLKGYRRAFKRERFTARVAAIVPCGTAKVYDVQVPGVNTFDANGLHAHNCGEQGLPPYGACLLGSINLTRFVRQPFSDSAWFDWEAYRDVVSIFTRMLDNVVEINGLPLPEQRAEIENKRRHGMGFLGLGSTITLLKMSYGDEASIAFTEQVTREMALAGWRIGLELAKEKGPAPIMEQEFEVTQAMLHQRPEMAADGIKVGDSLQGKRLHARYSRYMQQLATVDAKLVAQIEQHGCRFTHHSSIAPTGTISLSLANNASNGIEPSFAHHYSRNVIREGKKSKERVDVFSYELLAYRTLINPAAMPYSDNPAEQLPDYFIAADAVTPQQHVDIQAAAQKWIDSSISKTANVPTDYPFDEFKDIYLYAYEKRLKGCTTFRFNPEVFSGVLVKEQDLANTTYRFKLKNGDTVEVKGSDEIEYDGELHTAANLYDALKEGYYGKF
ncbi:ribonucleoside-diphosphate reductase [Ectothiorhodospiraceae bacterium BW-2]|nr:ribonucleoside-diphosphate reductase [Ectothiorhodospiraceae bacterium BW-2]